MAPGIFDSDFDAQILGDGKDLTQAGKVALPRIRVGDFGADAAGHDKHRRRAIAPGIAHRLFDPFNRSRPRRWVGGRERTGMLAATDARHSKAGVIARTQYIVLIEMTGKFDAF